MVDKYDEQLILGFIEGDLTPDQEHGFKLELMKDARLRNLVAQLIEDRDALRAMPAQTPPDSISEQIEMMMERSVLLGMTSAAPAAGDQTAKSRLKFVNVATYAAVAALVLIVAGLFANVLIESTGMNETVSDMDRGPVAMDESAQATPASPAAPETARESGRGRALGASSDSSSTDAYADQAGGSGGGGSTGASGKLGDPAAAPPNVLALESRASSTTEPNTRSMTGESTPSGNATSADTTDYAEAMKEADADERPAVAMVDRMRADDGFSGESSDTRRSTSSSEASVASSLVVPRTTTDDVVRIGDMPATLTVSGTAAASHAWSNSSEPVKVSVVTNDMTNTTNDVIRWARSNADQFEIVNATPKRRAVANLEDAQLIQRQALELELHTQRAAQVKYRNVTKAVAATAAAHAEVDAPDDMVATDAPESAIDKPGKPQDADTKPDARDLADAEADADAMLPDPVVDNGSLDVKKMPLPRQVDSNFITVRVSRKRVPELVAHLNRYVSEDGNEEQEVKQVIDAGDAVAFNEVVSQQVAAIVPVDRGDEAGVAGAKSGARGMSRAKDVTDAGRDSLKGARRELADAATIEDQPADEGEGWRDQVSSNDGHADALADGAKADMNAKHEDDAQQAGQFGLGQGTTTGVNVLADEVADAPADEPPAGERASTTLAKRGEESAEKIDPPAEQVRRLLGVDGVLEQIGSGPVAFFSYESLDAVDVIIEINDANSLEPTLDAAASLEAAVEGRVGGAEALESEAEPSD